VEGGGALAGPEMEPAASVTAAPPDHLFYGVIEGFYNRPWSR
jgi:hypothetical protein